MCFPVSLYSKGNGVMERRRRNKHRFGISLASYTSSLKKSGKEAVIINGLRLDKEMTKLLWLMLNILISLAWYFLKKNNFF